MTLWLVMLVAMLAILSPMMWLRPSRRDRRLGQLREHARKAGVTVKFGKPPLHHPPAGLVSYRWLYSQDGPGPYFVLVREEYASDMLKPVAEDRKEWRWRIEPLRPFSEKVRDDLEQMLEKLPEDALVLESERRYLTLWWGESQSAEVFDTTHTALVAMCEALGKQGEDSATAENRPY
ncbi:preprotein translocase subunit YajC [Halomonas sp. GXIMD04776]|uniref:preprotein translocase subunit YajC n=1 Tax=Halomonas sp. GXIMD04776 TaxID=3415605 RepID=UPI003C94F85A